MMVLRIKVPFFDKYTHKHYDEGEEIHFEDDRAKELLGDDRGLVEAVEIPFAEETVEAEASAEEEEKPKKKKATKKK